MNNPRRTPKGKLVSRQVLPSARRLSRKKKFVERRRAQRAEALNMGIEIQLEEIAGPAAQDVPIPSPMQEEEVLASLASDEPVPSSSRCQEGASAQQVRPCFVDNDQCAMELELLKILGPAVPSIPVPSPARDEDLLAILSNEEPVPSSSRFQECCGDVEMRDYAEDFEDCAGNAAHQDPRVMDVRVDPVGSNATGRDSDSPLEDLVIEEELQETVENVADRNARDKAAKKRQKMEGSRIVNLQHFMEQLQALAEHSERFACGIAHFRIVSQKQNGLRTIIKVKCNMCHYEGQITSHPEEESVIDVNHGAVAGMITTGGGHAQLEESLAAMNIPCMSERQFDKCHENLVHDLKNAAATQMNIAAAEEKRLAIARGDIVPGTNLPHIPVVTDGAWMRRSYRSGKYSSLSGVAAIVGYRTKKVLFYSVRNKFCVICERAMRNEKEPRAHICYKNWGRNQASTAMESDIIVEGFMSSIEMHGLVYSTMIADGDSSVYKKIRDSDPYKNMLVVKKVECSNHVLRNMTTKLTELGKKMRKGPSKTIFQANVNRIRVSVHQAAVHRMDEKNVPHAMKIANLKRDIENIPSHIFGEHLACRELGYFCSGESKEGEVNMVPELMRVGAYQQLVDILKRPRILADSLLHNMNSNAVESFNGIIAKFIGGKRINFGRKGSYTARCAAAVVQYNTGAILCNLSRAMDKQPSKLQEEVEKRRNLQVARTAKAKGTGKQRRSYVQEKAATRDKDYGDKVQRPDLEKEEYAEELRRHHATLGEWQGNWERIEFKTRGQGENEEWYHYRRHLLTASNFGPVCTRMPTTKCASLVRQLVYPQCLNVSSLAYGKKNEDVARRAVEAELEVRIEPCGLFIDRTIPYLGASPDGLIDEDGIVEIKCPKSAEAYTPQEAYVRCKAVRDIYEDDTMAELKKRHRYYFQVQGQLHVTARRYCMFALWTPKGLKCTQVYRDDQFWFREMEPKLTRFYEECMVPELVDGRYNRGMPIREPRYILDAIEKKAKQEAGKKKAKGKRTSPKQN